MSEKNKLCVFCRVKDENVIFFTLSTLQQCEFILKCRKKYQLKFNDVIFPQSKKEKKSLMMLRNSKEYQVAFAKLADCHGVIDDATFEQIEEFVCQT